MPWQCCCSALLCHANNLKFDYTHIYTWKLNGVQVYFGLIAFTCTRVDICVNGSGGAIYRHPPHCHNANVINVKLFIIFTTSPLLFSLPLSLNLSLASFLSIVFFDLFFSFVAQSHTLFLWKKIWTNITKEQVTETQSEWDARLTRNSDVNSIEWMEWNRVINTAYTNTMCMLNGFNSMWKIEQ